MLLAEEPRTADQSVELRRHEHVGAPQAGRAGEARAIERRGELRPRHRPVGEGIDHELLASRERGGVEPLASVHRAVRPMHPRRGQLEQPAQVVGGDEVPGRTEHVGADEPAGLVVGIDLAARSTPVRWAIAQTAAG